MGKGSVTLEVHGRSELMRQFADLSEQARSKVLRGAVTDAAEVIRAEAEVRVPVGETGNLLSSLVVKPGKVSRVFAGAIVGHTRKGSHAHLVEFGTQPHDITRANGGVVKHPGAKPRPYMFPAFESKRAAAVQVIESAMSEAVREVAGG